MGKQPPTRAASSLVRALRDARAGPSCSLPGQAAPAEPRGNHLTGGPVLNVEKGPVLDVG